MKTFKQALKPKGGWKHADNESMCAAVAEAIALHCCLNTEQVYNWIRKHYADDWETVWKMRNGEIPYLDIVGPILWDQKI